MITLAAYFVILFGVLILATCLWALFRPQSLFQFARPMLERGWLMFLAVGIRIVLGITLLLVAEASAFPLTFTILGGVAIVAAVALPFIGMETLPTVVIRRRVQRILAQSMRAPPARFRDPGMRGPTP